MKCGEFVVQLMKQAEPEHEIMFRLNGEYLTFSDLTNAALVGGSECDLALIVDLDKGEDVE